MFNSLFIVYFSVFYMFNSLFILVCSTCLTVCLPTDQGLNVEVKYFQLGSIKIPSDVENRYIQALVLQEQAEEELLKQDSIVIRKETSQMV